MDTLFKMITEQSPNMIFINQMGRVVYVNRKCEEIMGYTAAEFLSADFDFRSLTVPESRPLVDRAFQKHRQGQEVIPYEYVIVTKTGKRLDAIITTKLIDYQGGPAILGIITDISDRKNAETLYKSIFENNGTATVIFNTAGTVELINEETTVLSGFSKAEVEHKRQWSDFVFKDDLPMVVKYNQQRQIDPASVPKRYEFRLVNRRGEVKNVLMNVDFIPALNKFVASFLDITSLKQAEEVLRRDKETFERMVTEKSQEVIATQRKLEESKHLSSLGTMAATVAHELRNPLGVIAAAVYNIKRKTKDVSLRKHLKNIELKIAESDRTIADLLDFSRLKIPVPGPVRLAELLADCALAAEKRFHARAGSIRRSFFLGGRESEVQADRHQLKLVFDNILDNAFQALSGRPGKIEIGLKDKGAGSLLVSINDTGSGIGKNDLKKVFDPFFTTKPKGTGLGLTLCQELVRLHGGRITIKSQKGKGTEVSLTLPR